MQAPPGGTTPVQMSSQMSSMATSFATSVDAQSARPTMSRHWPAAVAFHAAPSAAALLPRAVISAATSASHAGSPVPLDAWQHFIIVAHHALAKRAGNPSAGTDPPPAVLPPPQPSPDKPTTTALSRIGARIATMYLSDRSVTA